MASRCLFATDRPEISAMLPMHLAAFFGGATQRHRAYKDEEFHFLEIDFAFLDVEAIDQFAQAAAVDWLDEWEARDV